MLSAETISLVKATLPVLANAGTAVTEHFYQRMFAHNPELKDIFNLSHQKSGRQPAALFAAVAAYAQHIETPEMLAAAVERIAQKHTSFLVRPEHYAIVGEHLLATLQELAPDTFDAATTAAWAQAYQFLAGIFIDREGTLYALHERERGGWAGERAFRLARKEPESEKVTSFYFEPLDGGPVMDFLPGQYIGIKVKPSQGDYQEIRQYSLSAAPNGKDYRISVKREDQGLVSRYLHDELAPGAQVALIPPAGDFFLDTQSQGPVVLVSAGVGLTPMMSMLESLCAQQPGRPVQFLHACETAAQHSFKDRQEELAESPGLTLHSWYNDQQGLMDLAPLRSQLPLGDGHFYLCGPIPFMAAIKGQLLGLGVAEGRIHYEAFGPHADL